jgi:hypothetical protein
MSGHGELTHGGAKNRIGGKKGNSGAVVANQWQGWVL